MSTSMPSAADLGIVANSGTDQSALINTALSNPSYSGIVFDFPSNLLSPAKVYISNSINGQGKVLKFIPGTIITGPTSATTPVTTVSDFILDCGVRQQCFDLDCKLEFNPSGTMLGKISPWVLAAAALSGAGQVFMDTTTSSGFTITAGSSALAASTLYLWNIEVR